MSKLIQAVRLRFQQLEDLDSVSSSNEGKILSTRVSRELFDKVEYISSILEMNKSDFLRMIISNAIDDIIQEFKISFGPGVGMTPSEFDDFMNLPDEEKQALIEKWQGRSKGDEA
ncbi:hypothetical protein [Geobacillus sp. ZGt-1]|uniref:hypothetical protein n=1 Tax=Geobacillus sp. ZGt-1 TaxID=1631556 RepID=UPI000649B000|nr:hypothetical protein [Geobacillus sp. ZGt-1]